MALSSSALSSLIQSELSSRGFDVNNPRKDTMPWLKYFCDAVAAAVVTHITSSAEVQTDAGAPDSEHHGTVY